MSYPGSRKIVTITVKDEDGALTEADVTVEVDPPGGAPAAVTPVDVVSTGVYTCVVDCPTVGQYAIRAEASGALVAVDEATWRILPSTAVWD